MTEETKRIPTELELGFGKSSYRDRLRFISADGRLNVRREGMGWLTHIDFFHWLISISAAKLFALIILWYLAINLLFGCVYYAIGAENFGGVDQHTSETQKFMTLFYFSSQTITTIGFGQIHPIGNAASIAAAAEGLLGLLSFAVATGIVFGRFSRPRAHILYSRHALLAPYHNMQALMFRIANKKQYELIECEASLTLAINNPANGKREFYSLPLELNRINFLALSWTVVHPINDQSALNGLSVQDLDERDAEILILVKAINDTFSQTVFSRYSYKAADIRSKAKFRPLKQDVLRDGRLRIAVNDIHQYEDLT